MSESLEIKFNNFQLITFSTTSTFKQELFFFTLSSFKYFGTLGCDVTVRNVSPRSVFHVSRELKAKLVNSSHLKLGIVMDRKQVTHEKKKTERSPRDHSKRELTRTWEHTFKWSTWATGSGSNRLHVTGLLYLGTRNISTVSWQLQINNITDYSYI